MSVRMISIAVVTTGEAQGLSEAFAARAKRVGQLVAELGCTLITGGGQGGMASVAQGFCETPYRVGQSIGVIPGSIDWSQSKQLGEIGALRYSPKHNYPNPWIEVPIFTHQSSGDPKSELSSNIINVASADIVITLAGDKGTQAEVELALELPNKPVFVLLAEGEKIGQLDASALSGGSSHVVTEFDALRALLESAVSLFALKRPTYASLSGVYKTDPNSVHQCTMSFPNTCAIRMSEALDKVVLGIKDKFAASGKTLCPHNFMRGAQDLAGVLQRADVFGVQNAGFSKPGQAPAAIKGVQGIVAYMNIPGYEGQGHIDLWDGNNPVGDAYWNADPIWFWKLN
jgi:hypothetical protein